MTKLCLIFAENVSSTDVLSTTI